MTILVPHVGRRGRGTPSVSVGVSGSLVAEALDDVDANWKLWFECEPLPRSVAMLASSRCIGSWMSVWANTWRAPLDPLFPPLAGGMSNAG